MARRKRHLSAMYRAAPSPSCPEGTSQKKRRVRFPLGLGATPIFSPTDDDFSPHASSEPPCYTLGLVPTGVPWHHALREKYSQTSVVCRFGTEHVPLASLFGASHDILRTLPFSKLLFKHSAEQKLLRFHDRVCIGIKQIWRRIFDELDSKIHGL